MKSDNNIIDLENILFDLKVTPEKWFAVAQKLKIAALTLKKFIPNSENKIENRYQEFMLWGFCLENLFKGILADKRAKCGDSIVKKNKQKVNEYKGPSHNLIGLAKDIDFKLNIEEELALKFYTQAIMYFGRYPIPKNSSKQAIYWQSNFDDILLNIVARLKKQVVEIKF